MSFASAFLHDRFTTRVEPACQRQWRQELLAQLEGPKIRGMAMKPGAGISAAALATRDRQPARAGQ